MTTDQINHHEARLQKLVELRWQRETIAHWVANSEMPAQAHSHLEILLVLVNAELQTLEGTPNDHDASEKDVD
jgi:hypothetical protein